MMSRTVGMAAAVADLRLRSSGRSGKAASFTPTGLDDEMLRAADAAVATSTPLAFVLPFPAPAAAIQLSAAAIVGAIALNRGSDVSVAVAATNLTTATTYDHLYLRTEQLGAFVPRVRVTADGTVRGQAPPDAHGRLYVTGALSRLSGLLDRLDALVVDASAVTADDLDTLLSNRHSGKGVEGRPGRPALLYLTSNPLDHNLDTWRRHGGLVWGWDAPGARGLAGPAGARASEVATGNAAVVVPADLIEVAATGRIVVAAPDQPTPLDTALTTLWQALGQLLGAYAAAPASAAWSASGSATRWAWSMYHVAAASPVSATRYDEHVRVNPYFPAGRLADAPRVAREYARAAAGSVRAAWFNVDAAFTDVVDAGHAQEKLAALVAWVTARTDGAERGAVLVPNSAMVAAVTAALAESPDTSDAWERHVTVGTRRDLPNLVAPDADGRRPRLCLLAGVPRSGAGLFAAPPTCELTIIAAGPGEAGRVTHAAIDARSKLGQIRWETTQLTSDLLEVPANSPYVAEDPAAAPLHHLLAALPAAAENDSPWEPLTLDLLALLHDVVNEPDAEASPPARITEENVDLDVDAIVLHLERAGVADPAVLLLEPNDLVARRRGERVDRVAAKSLTAGDIVLLVDQHARKDLMTTVIEKLSESTTYATLARLVAFWHDRAALAKADGQTYRSILDRMNGTTVTSDTTIGAWVRADVDGPQDKANIARFALAVGDTMLLQEAERVAWALTFLHRVHRKVGAWLSAQVGDAILTPTDATVDAALDVHVSDLLDAVTSWRVAEVEPERQRTPVPQLGALLQPVPRSRPGART